MGSGEGTPIAYTALTKGTPVISRSGRRFGSVHRVVDDPAGNILHGIVVDTKEGHRFVGRDLILKMTTTQVQCSLSDDDVDVLPPVPRARRRFALRVPRRTAGTGL
ncbi:MULTISPECIES: PRC-barrel domain-containing protein [Arthrobacter]|jgi:uncharacterized protein YrrD|uniref:PRC-barrel domain-containing protein n=1 Tax=Arthrobacter nitrophenolicus TaxID=683150 RepID=A0A4R5XZ77_9MICC|nr:MULTISPECIES: PRC-barrel domain-containing protein [Arthrobacter]MDP9987315.1 uncharacterized protein YrrD [Arthrobacter oryzae]TDL37263.1 hypothetical protein E2R57_10965 [Arthrobacter nitrophenolicus]